MKQFTFLNVSPTIDPSAFIAEGAVIIGRVRIGVNSSVWHNSVIRGDVNDIKIGDNTNIQDLSMLHVAGEYPLIIGDKVTIGHNVNLHACTIEDSCLIGIGAVVLDGAVIGKGSVVGAGAVVAPGTKFPENSLIMGCPAKIKRELTSDEIAEYGRHYERYVRLASGYADKSLSVEI